MISLILSLALAKQIDCNHSLTRINCVKYVSLHDADTITFEIPNFHKFFSLMTVRLNGVDAPEVNSSNKCESALAKEATEFVKKELEKAKVINLLDVKKDKYFRLLAEIELDGKILSRILLSKGFAYKYDGGTKQVINWCKSE